MHLCETKYMTRTLQQLPLQRWSCHYVTLFLTDAANIPGIDDMRLAAESSDFSSMSGLSSSTNQSIDSSCHSSVDSEIAGGSNENDSNNEAGQSIVDMDASQSAVEPTDPNTIKLDGIDCDEFTVESVQSDASQHAHADSNMLQEYVYPAYLREGPGRDFLALSLDMRAANPSDRPSWSAILRRLREAGS